MMDRLKELQRKIGYEFKDVSILKNAITHSSYTNETKDNHGRITSPDNERLEFLGDAVLELATSRYIYHTFPEMQEGKMTKYRASIVCEPTLAACARDFGLPSYLLLGRGEESMGGRERESIVSDAFEALIGAVYLDGGAQAAERLIEDFILKDVDERVLFSDSKSALQEIVHGMGRTLEYYEISQTGPQHAMTFTEGVKSDGMFDVEGEGHTKKSAQQAAAYKAIKLLKKSGIID